MAASAQEEAAHLADSEDVVADPSRHPTIKNGHVFPVCRQARWQMTCSLQAYRSQSVCLCQSFQLYKNVCDRIWAVPDSFAATEARVLYSMMPMVLSLLYVHAYYHY